MPDQQVDILIKTTAAGDGAKKAEDGIKGVKDATKAAGAAQTEAAKSSEKLSEGLKEQSKHSEFLGLNHRGLHKVVHQLGEQFPIAGAAARAMLNPILFAFTGAIAIFSKAKESLDEWNKELDEAGKAAAEPTFADALKLKREALEQFATAAALFKDQMAHLVDPEKEYHKAIETTIELLRDQYAAQTMVANAEKGRKLEDINRNERSLEGASGHLTKEGAAIARNRVEEEYRRRDEAARQQERKDVVENKQGELTHTINAQAGLDAEREAAIKASKAATTRRIEHESNLQIAAKAQEALEKKYSDADKVFQDAGGQAELDKVNNAPAGAFPSIHEGYVYAANKRKTDRDEAAAALYANKGLQQKYTAGIGAEKTEEKLADTAVTRADADAVANKQKLKDLEEEIAKLKAKNSISTRAETEAGKQNRATDLSHLQETISQAGELGSTVVTGVTQSETTASRILRHDPTVTPEERGQVHEFAQLGSGKNNLTDDQSAAYLRVQASDPDKNAKLIEAIVQKLEASNEANSRTTQAWLKHAQLVQTTVDALEKQVKEVLRRTETQSKRITGNIPVAP